MRVARRTTAIVFGIFVALATSVPARAGGPTSALLVAPGSNAVALYNGDSEYAELSELVSAYDSDVAGGPDENPRRHARGPFVTVTWMLHDVQVWRVDRIYYEATGEPWIYSVDNVRASSHGRWHRSPEPDELVDFLEQHNLTDGEYAGPLVPPVFADEPVLAGEGQLAAPADRSMSDREQATSTDSRATTSDDAGWWWAGGGALGGALLGAGAVVIYPRVRSRRPKGQQLIDY